MQGVIRKPNDIMVAWIKDREHDDKFLLGEVRAAEEPLVFDFDAAGMSWVSQHPDWYDMKQGSLAQFLAD